MPRPAGWKRGTPATEPHKASKNTPITKVVDQLERNPGLTYNELGKLNGTGHVAMIKLLARHGITREHVEEYKSGRAELFAGIQERVLLSITSGDIEKASLRDKVIAAGVIYDKERLERGQSTSNVSVLFAVAEEAEELQRTQGQVVVTE